MIIKIHSLSNFTAFTCNPTPFHYFTYFFYYRFEIITSRSIIWGRYLQMTQFLTIVLGASASMLLVIESSDRNSSTGQQTWRVVSFWSTWHHQVFDNWTILPACSRRRSDLERDGIVNTLHCDSMGNYEPLQCDPDQCWCVEPQTGDVRSPVVPRRMMPNLPCCTYTIFCQSKKIKFTIIDLDLLKKLISGRNSLVKSTNIVWY